MRSREILKKWNVRSVRAEHGRGVNAARNTGVRATTAELVAFLDDDVYAPPGWLHAVRDGAPYPDAEASVADPCALRGQDPVILRP